MMGFGMLLVGLLWIALIFGGVWLVRAFFQSVMSSKSAGRSQPPGEILAERYARGEISREQYELMKSDLGSDPS